jgi:RNA polymerase sigma factor (sigma-70 family)
LEESTAEPQRLLEDNLDLIERLVRFVCRNKMNPDDVEDFASEVKLRLIDGNYAILRKFEGRCTLATYLTTVFRRLFSDYQIHLRGKYHPSAAAQRLGPVALEIDRLLRRDGKSLEETVLIMTRDHPELTRAEVEGLAAQLPEKKPHAAFVSADDLDGEIAVPADPIEADAMAGDRSHTASEIADIMHLALNELSTEELAILRMHFVGEMTVAEIARSLQVEQKPLYRKIQSVCDRLRKKLEGAGIAAADAADIIGRADTPALDFGLRAMGKPAVRTSSIKGSGTGRKKGPP